MAEVEVRLITGESVFVRCSALEITIKEFKELLAEQHREDLKNYQLFYNVGIVKISVKFYNICPLMRNYCICRAQK